MKTVSFVKAVVVEKVQKLSGIKELMYARTCPPDHLSRVSNSSEVLLCHERVESVSVPIIHLCHVGAEDTYVAYSAEVEKSLGIPIRAIVAGQKAAERASDKASTEFNLLLDAARELYRMRWFDRLKFLVGAYKLKSKLPRGWL